MGGRERLTYEYVSNYIKEQNGELLETKYVNSKTRMKCKCKCGNIFYSAWNDFSQGRNVQCKICRYKNSADKQRHTYEYVFNYFKEHHCTLLETTYITTHTPMKYICECGNESTICFANFQDGQRCMECHGNNNITYPQVFFYFLEQKCFLLETKYIDSKTKMEYRCSCGNISSITWGNFKTGYRCKKCANKKVGDSKRHSYEYISNYFKEQKCELLETEYYNGKTKMKYRCSCGNESTTIWINFLKGQRCGCEKSHGETKILKILKENNIKFEPNKRFNNCRSKKPLPFDFYIIDKNICIEFGGQQHYRAWGKVNNTEEQAAKEFELLKIRDEIKTKYCEDNNIPLIRIPYWDINHIEEILIKENIIGDK